MAIEVTIPTPLRGMTNNADIVKVEGSTVIEIIDNLNQQFPGMKERLTDDKGNLRRSLIIYINGEDVRYLEDKSTAVKAGDDISILPAFAGG